MTNQNNIARLHPSDFIGETETQSVFPKSKSINRSNGTNGTNRGNGTNGTKCFASVEGNNEVQNCVAFLNKKEKITSSIFDHLEEEQVIIGVLNEKIELGKLEQTLINQQQWYLPADITSIKLDLFLNNNKGPNMKVWFRTTNGVIREMVSRLQDNRKSFITNINNKFTGWEYYRCYAEMENTFSEIKLHQQNNSQSFVAGKLRDIQAKGINKTPKEKSSRPMNPFMTAWALETEDEFKLGCYIHGVEVARTVNKVDNQSKSGPTASVYLTVSETKWVEG